MIALNLTTFVLLYLLVGMALIFGLWWYYDFRDQRAYAVLRSRILFHCIKCSHLYSGARTVQTAPCPKCGFDNSRLKF